MLPCGRGTPKLVTSSYTTITQLKLKYGGIALFMGQSSLVPISERVVFIGRSESWCGRYSIAVRWRDGGARPIFSVVDHDWLLWR